MIPEPVAQMFRRRTEPTPANFLPGVWTPDREARCHAYRLLQETGTTLERLTFTQRRIGADLRNRMELRP